MHPPDVAHPFALLTPDTVADALASVGLRCDGRLQALSSYENRVYQLYLEDGQAVVAKFYRPERWDESQILEEHAFAAQLQAAEVPVVAPLILDGRSLHHHGGFGFSVSPRRGGRVPELDDEEVLVWIGRFLARLHTVGAQQPFLTRPDLDLTRYALEPRNWLLQHQAIALDVQRAWQVNCEIAIKKIAEYSALTGVNTENHAEDGTPQRLRLHGDCHPGNILWTPLDASGVHGPHIVDLDDACMGPAVQDLWMLLSGERAQRSWQLACLLDGYEQVRAFDRRELVLIEPLRTLRLIHYSAWLARRWDDPAFPRSFPWFGSSDYWQGQVQMLQDQIEAMQEPPLAV